MPAKTRQWRMRNSDWCYYFYSTNPPRCHPAHFAYLFEKKAPNTKNDYCDLSESSTDRVMKSEAKMVESPAFSMDRKMVGKARPPHEPPVGKRKDDGARSLSVRDGKISVHPPRKATARRLGSLRYAFGDSGSGVQCANFRGILSPSAPQTPPTRRGRNAGHWPALDITTPHP